MPFQPGNTEWQKAKKNKPVADAYRMEAAALAAGEIVDHPKGSLRWNAQRMLMAGEVATFREASDRLDGKPAQAIVGDDEYDPIRITEVELTIVDPKKP